MLKLSDYQQQIVAEQDSCFVIGAAGTGKTTTLIEKAASLVETSPPAEDVYIVLFSYRSYLIAKEALINRLGEAVAQRVKIATLRDFAAQAIINAQANDKPINFVSNTNMRRCLRQSMREADFKGTAIEAEHIIRQFKAKAKKPTGTEPYYSLMSAYKTIMEKNNYTDRYDIVRQHIVGMRNNSIPPLNIKHLFIDNIQDATRIQLLWIFDHIKNNAIITAFGCDDLCAFYNDGAIGSESFAELASLNLKKYSLNKCFRTPSPLGEALNNIVTPIKSHINKQVSFNDKTTGQLSIKNYTSPSDEINNIIHSLPSIAKNNAKIGIITRTDSQAVRISNAFKKANIKHSLFANAIWHIPGAIMVLDLLHLLLNQAENKHLYNVMLGYGVNNTVINKLFESGLQAREWLKNGAGLPSNIDLPNTALNECAIMQRELLGYYKLMAEKKIQPQEAFKAASHSLLTKMPPDDKQAALIALNELLSLKGNLIEALPKINQWQQPTLNSKIIIAPVKETRGMEFNYVIMPFCSNNNYPYAGYKIIDNHEDKERRLFYLAATRALNGLYITYSDQPSPFIANLKSPKG